MRNTRNLREKGSTRRNCPHLNSVEPTISLKKAIAMVCRPIYGDCKHFVERVNLVLGLDIRVFYRCLKLDCESCN